MLPSTGRVLFVGTTRPTTFSPSSRFVFKQESFTVASAPSPRRAWRRPSFRVIRPRAARAPGRTARRGRRRLRESIAGGRKRAARAHLTSSYHAAAVGGARRPRWRGRLAGGPPGPEPPALTAPGACGIIDLDGSWGDAMALEMPPGTREVSREDNLITMNMGPQHPSTHGVFRLILTLDGETVVAARPVMGYLHRSVEKLCESRTYLQDVIFTDRLDYVASMSTNLPYAMVLEKLAGIEVPERSQYIRVLMCELQRIAAHLVAIGTFAADVGTFFTPLLYTFRERERILDIYEMCCGARLTVSYIRYGGVSRDIPEDGVEAIRELCEIMPARIDEYERLLTTNEIFLARTRN